MTLDFLIPIATESEGRINRTKWGCDLDVLRLKRVSLWAN